MAWRDLQLPSYFTDPSQSCWAIEKSKRGPTYPRVTHIQARESSCVESCHNSLWIRPEFKKDSKCEPRKGNEDNTYDELRDLIRACTKEKDLSRGIQIHARILKKGLLEKDVYLGTNLLNMYAKCGALEKAQHVFDELPVRNVVTWTALIAGYIEHGLNHKALMCFECMRDEDVSPNVVTYICVLKACGSTGASKKGKELHGEVRRKGLLRNHLVLGTALMDMYVKCGALETAQEVFDELPERDVVVWTALISGYAQQGLTDLALRCFGRMQDEGLFPNAVTYICILKACGNKRTAKRGGQIHAQLGKLGLLENDIVLGTTLVDMYVNCGMLVEAQAAFDELQERNVVTWNALLSGYSQQGLGEEAFNCFERMRDAGISPDAITFVCMLEACGHVQALAKGEEIHAEVDRQGWLEKDIMLGNALVDMYGKCGACRKAQKVFDKLPARDVVTWTALISGYVQNGFNDEALECFRQMQPEGLSSSVTCLCILKACGSIGAAEKGEEIHTHVLTQRLLEEDIMIGNALVDMYAKCGMLAKAQELFDKLSGRDVVTWNALIGGYAQVGKAKRVSKLFRGMIVEGIDPDEITYLALLMVSSHGGLVMDGQKYFDCMSTVHGMIPMLEHYICLVDLLSRAGRFDTAISIIESSVPPSDQLVAWSAFMGACRSWVNVELGRCAFERVFGLDENFGAAYFCMNNLYTGASMQEEMSMVRPLI